MNGHGITISEERCLHLTFNETVNIVYGRVDREQIHTDCSKPQALIFEYRDGEFYPISMMCTIPFRWNGNSYYIDIDDILIPDQIQKLATEPFVLYHTPKKVITDSEGENPVCIYADVFLQAESIGSGDKYVIQHILSEDTIPITVHENRISDINLHKVRKYIDILLEDEKGDSDD